MNWIELSLGAIHKLRHTNYMIFYLSPPLVTGGHISVTPPSVTSHILQFYTYKLLNYELARHRIALSEHRISLRVYWLSCSMFNFNDFQWNCFNLVYTPKYYFWNVMSQNLGSPPCHTSSTPSRHLTCDVIYGWSLINFEMYQSRVKRFNSDV